MNQSSSIQDIKLVQRFMFDNSIYMLNMFQKKVDSFIGYKSKKARQKQLNTYKQQGYRVDPNTFFDDPIKTLSKDLTKPIWNCTVKIDPVVYLESTEDQINPEREEQSINIQEQQINHKRILFNYLVKIFINRYKIQHQDESNLRINILNYSSRQNYKKFEDKQSMPYFQIHTQNFLKLIMKCINKQIKYLQSLQDLSQNQQRYAYMRRALQAYFELLGSYLQNQNQKLKKELNWFINLTLQATLNILDCKAGATLMLYQPKIGFMNFLVHPLMITVHNMLAYQFNYNDKDKGIKKKENNNDKVQDENQNKQIQIQDEEQDEKTAVAFQQLKYTNCSKVAFINLDGYQSEYNLDVVKYLSKNMMYVSFPKEYPAGKQQNQELNEFQQGKSQRLLRKYFYQGLSQEQKNSFLQYHQLPQKQWKRNMYILPIYSRYLSQKYDLKTDPNIITSTIQFYESTFIKFIMEELIFSQLRQFNPSIIILSYSGKIKIQNQYFALLIKQLTIISNFRLMFYFNKTKMFSYSNEEKNEKVQVGQEFFNLQKQYYNKNEQTNIDAFYAKNPWGNFSKYYLNLNQQFDLLQIKNMQLNFFEKISIFLKISSGTYNLQKAIQQDSHIQKYKNYKIMRYSALLLKLFGKQFPSIDRIKNRANDYLTINKVLKNKYQNRVQTFDKLFQKVVGKYHDNLLKVVEGMLLINTNNTKINSQLLTEFIILQELNYLSTACQDHIKTLKLNYDQIALHQLFQNFKFQYRLQVSTQKTQSRVYLHIPKYKDIYGFGNNSIKSLNNFNNFNYNSINKQATATFKYNVQDYLAIAQFQIIEQKQKISVQFTSNTKILYSKERNFKETLIYVINHLPKITSSIYMSFYGILNQTFDQKADYKINLRPITFITLNQTPKVMSQFQNYVDFNLFQTSKFIFLFWPRIYNQVKQKLCRLLGQKYTPDTTWDIYRAYRQQPGLFYQLNVLNSEEYQYIIPRNGCTCYQYHESMNRFYIFGGVYNQVQNYFKFQTDISYIQWAQQNMNIQVHNIDKSFFMLTQSQEQKKGMEINFHQSFKGIKNAKYIVKEFKNDFVRPKTHYEIYQPQLGQKQKKQIFLLGGIGEKFNRTYSFLSYTGMKLIFSLNGQIQTIRKIKTYSILPVNLFIPLKLRSPQQMNILTNGQNRLLQINQGSTTHQSYTLSYYKYKYDEQQQKFDFQTVYEFADLDKRSYRDETQLLRRPPSDVPVKYQLMASSFRGKQFNDNFIKVSSQNGKKYIFELQLQLSAEVKSIYHNYQKLIKLTGASIKAIDINASMLYCLIKHQSYTLDKCILAHFDINQLAGKLVDSKQVQINLKQIYKFQEDVSKNIIVVANSSTILVLHGFKLNNQIEIKQIIIKKSKKLKTINVLASLQKSQILPNQNFLNKRLLNQIAVSFFINQNSGIIACLTFKTVQRMKGKNNINNEGIQGINIINNKNKFKFLETVYVRLQKLDLRQLQNCRWCRVFQKLFKLKIILQDINQLQYQNNVNANNSYDKNTNEYSNNSQQSVFYHQQSVPLNSASKTDYIRLIQTKGSKQKQKKQKQFILKAIYRQQVYSCILNIDNQSDQLIFIPLKQTQEQFYKSIYKENIKNESIMLQKGLGTYEQIKQQVYNNNMHGGYNSEKLNNNISMIQNNEVIGSGKYTKSIKQQSSTSAIETEQNN